MQSLTPIGEIVGMFTKYKGFVMPYGSYVYDVIYELGELTGNADIVCICKICKVQGHYRISDKEWQLVFKTIKDTYGGDYGVHTMGS